MVKMNFKNLLPVSKPVLLFTAGLLWMLAGINILRIGIEAFSACLHQGKVAVLLIALGALLIFAGFSMMFRRIVKKHQKRIMGYPEQKQSIFRCFDRKGYLLMIFMMTLGITLRASNLLPTVFFAVFYNGLGSALCFGGLMFVKYLKR